MTVDTVYKPVTYLGDGSQDTFAITFTFLDDDSIKVSVVDKDTGVATLQPVGVNYSVVNSNVVFDVNHIPTNNTYVLIEINPDYLQDTDYPEGDRFPAKSHEAALDKLTIMSQLNKDTTSRAVRVSPTVDLDSFNAALPSPVDDGYLKFKSDGSGFEVQTLTKTSGLGNVADDKTPQLGGDLDANGSNIQFDDGTGVQDDSGNDTLIFGKATDSVNHFKLSNSATADPLVLEALGGDSDIDIDIKTKGSGTLNITGDLQLNDSSKVISKVLDEDNFASDSDTALATQQSIKAYVASQGTDAADRSEMEAGTSTTTYVSPGVQHYHPSQAKFCCTFSDTPDIVVGYSYNILSVTRPGTGLYLVTLDTGLKFTDFSDAYTVNMSTSLDGSTVTPNIAVDIDNTDSNNIKLVTATPSGGTLENVPRIFITGFGEIA